MWFKLSQIILRNRFTILIVLALLTAGAAYFASHVKVNTKFANMLPPDDPVSVKHKELNERFGEDGNVMVIGIEGVDLFELDNFNAWYRLGKELEKIEGIDSVFSIAHMYELIANHDSDRFELELMVKDQLKTQSEVDSIKERILSQRFYSGLLFTDSSDLSLMMVTVDAEKFNGLNRGAMIHNIYEKAESYGKYFENLRYSGLPYIRDVVANSVKAELKITIGLAALVTALILFFFFRSVVVVLACLLVVFIGVIWSFGTMGILEYRITMLMGLIPPLIIVIGIPNCTYLLNKYHAEYTLHGNKVKALSRVIQKIGNATFLTNATTAMGFGTFVFTNSQKMQEFGVVALINIIAVFLISICVIPILFSFLKPPKQKHTKHLDKKWIKHSVNKLLTWVTGHRNWVYITTAVIIAISIYGLSRVETTGNISSDLPQGNPVLTDLKYFEKEFGGIMPFEVVIDANVEKGAADKELLLRIEKIQQEVEQYELNGERIFAKSLSIADAIKYAHQALNEGDSDYYNLDLSGSERLKLSRYTKNAATGGNVGNAFLDSTTRYTRVSFQIADIGSKDMKMVTEDIRTFIDSILNPTKGLLIYYQNVYNGPSDDRLKQSLIHDLFASSVIQEKVGDLKYWIEEEIAANDSASADLFLDPEYVYSLVGTPAFDQAFNRIVDESIYSFDITGTSVVFARGTIYMIQNLIISLAIAVVIIALLMALLFGSIRMVLVSLLPNFIPLLVTGGIMGLTGIPIKPSTILVFSIAFGISIDDTIHYLAKYRQELKLQSWNIRGSVLRALRETGVSMIYTSIVLFFGFCVFITSDFGGTVALGLLVSITLLVAMLSNLVLLPSLLLTLDKIITNKAFKEPLLEMIDEEEDIELDDLEVQKRDQ